VFGEGTSNFLNEVVFGEVRSETSEEYRERITGTTTPEPRFTQQHLNILQQIQEEINKEDEKAKEVEQFEGYITPPERIGSENTSEKSTPPQLRQTKQDYTKNWSKDIQEGIKEDRKFLDPLLNDFEAYEEQRWTARKARVDARIRKEQSEYPENDN